MTIGIKKLLKRTALSVTFALAALGVYSYEVEPRLLTTTNYVVDTNKWTQPDIKIAMAADFHVGAPHMDLERLKGIVEKINATKPDIILLPGDFLTMIGDNRVIGGEYVPPGPIAEVLAGLKAPLGVYATLGNHDMMNEPLVMMGALQKAGIKVLDNDAFHVKTDKYDFWVAGLADDTTSRPDWKATDKKMPGNAPVILIMHDPGAFLEKMERPALTVAGHTHGGQALPWILKHMTNPYSRAPMKYLYGRIDEEGRTMIVTDGIGTSIVPLRIGAMPEIVSIKLEHPQTPKPAQPQPGVPIG